MPNTKGADRGGIRTLEDLMRRCEVDPVTECWHCSYGLRKGVPYPRFVTPGSYKARTASGRRAAMWLRDGHDIRSGFWAFARECCHSLDCVNPEHSRAGTRKHFGVRMAISGRYKNDPKRVSGNRIHARSRSAFTMEDIRAIRASGATEASLALQYGCSKATIGQIRRRETWREEGFSGSSIFALAEAA